MISIPETGRGFLDPSKAAASVHRDRGIVQSEDDGNVIEHMEPRDPFKGRKTSLRVG